MFLNPSNSSVGFPLVISEQHILWACSAQEPNFKRTSLRSLQKATSSPAWAKKEEKFKQLSPARLVEARKREAYSNQLAARILKLRFPRDRPERLRPSSSCKFLHDDPSPDAPQLTKSILEQSKPCRTSVDTADVVPSPLTASFGGLEEKKS
jgi:hypothetical protein